MTKRYTVQAKLATYQDQERTLVWTDMHETDDQANAEERMYGYRRRNFIARVVSNVHPSRT